MFPMVFVTRREALEPQPATQNTAKEGTSTQGTSAMADVLGVTDRRLLNHRPRKQKFGHSPIVERLHARASSIGRRERPIEMDASHLSKHNKQSATEREPHL